MNLIPYVIALLIGAGITLAPSVVENTNLGNAAQTWIPTSTMLKPFNATYGLLVPGLATSTSSGCLEYKSNGYIFSSTGAPCGSGSGSSAFEVATTTDIALSEVAYITKTSGRTTLGSVATGTISSANSALTVTGSRYALGGATTFTIATTSNNMFSGTAGQILAFLNGGWTGVSTTTIPLDGDVTGTLSATVVGNDSHDHTGATLSGIDISSDTNLSGDSEIVLTGDALSIASTIARDSELHSAVTLSGALDYITLVGQDIVRGAIDLATDITGVLPIANGGTNNSSAYTAGSVIFSDGTSLTQDNASLFFDDSNNSLGIGSTSPWARLAINPVAGDGNSFAIGSSTATKFVINNAGNVGVGGTNNPVVPFFLSDSSDINSALYTTDKFIFAYENSAPGFTGIEAGGTALSRVVFKGVRARGTLASPTVPNENDSVFTILGAIWDGDQTLATGAIDFIVDGAVSNNVAPQRIGFLTGATNSRTERMTITSDGLVGIGTTTPSSKLHVTNTGSENSFLVEDSTSPDTSPFIITQTGAVGIGTSTPRRTLSLHGADNTVQAEVHIPVANASITTADTFVEFTSTAGSIGSIAGTASAGVIAYNTFTGSHWTIIEDKTNVKPEYLLEATGKVLPNYKHLAQSRLACTRASQAIYGAYGGTNPEGLDTVLSIGTGYMWVKNTGENLKPGDLLMSSDKCGFAEKQKGSFLGIFQYSDKVVGNITVGKVMEEVQWEKGEEGRRIAVVYLGG